MVDGAPTASVYVAIICGLVTLFVTMICSVFGKKMTKLIPFIIGILSGYAVAAVLTAIGIKTGNDALRIIDFSGFGALVKDGVGLHTFFAVPDFTFFEAFGGFGEAQQFLHSCRCSGLCACRIRCLRRAHRRPQEYLLHR